MPGRERRTTSAPSSRTWRACSSTPRRHPGRVGDQDHRGLWTRDRLITAVRVLGRTRDGRPPRRSPAAGCRRRRRWRDRRDPPALGFRVPGGRCPAPPPEIPLAGKGGVELEQVVVQDSADPAGADPDTACKRVDPVGCGLDVYRAYAAGEHHRDGASCGQDRLVHADVITVTGHAVGIGGDQNIRTDLSHEVPDRATTSGSSAAASEPLAPHARGPARLPAAGAVYPTPPESRPSGVLLQPYRTEHLATGQCGEPHRSRGA